MTKHKKTITSAVFILLALGGLQAQDNTLTTGGEAIGPGGTVSYSVGQIVYSTLTEAAGSVSQGLQQPFEIFTTLGVNETTINLALNVYPNPTSDFLTLKTKKTEGLTIQLYDLQGKVLINQTVNSTSTNISLENQQSATYLLNVLKNNQIVKTFKIIKN
ncbi:T9SS type A sorting domain-containing protein [Olleya sp. Bg11-27]|uniref:T9SS type A sorting domain-containing protein n=1 Tax=Olleya sp. Bg11-27 TaxID=2058135 RepID=UPI000C31B528|nr:T9SS type A sorting domain-containing protein [Olleya sp. Bg11-27]AUC75681.1 hypothetical protein CW732_08345 [Olleya sp. Bg11-27]